LVAHHKIAIYFIITAVSQTDVKTNSNTSSDTPGSGVDLANKFIFVQHLDLLYAMIAFAAVLANS